MAATVRPSLVDMRDAAEDLRKVARTKEGPEWSDAASFPSSTWPNS